MKQQEVGEPSWEGASPWRLFSAELQNTALIMLSFPGHLQTFQDLSGFSPSLCPEPCLPRKRGLWVEEGPSRLPGALGR